MMEKKHGYTRFFKLTQKLKYTLISVNKLGQKIRFTNLNNVD